MDQRHPKSLEIIIDWSKPSKLKLGKYYFRQFSAHLGLFNNNTKN